MDWPNPQDYNEAIQHPNSCFSAPELQSAEIELNAIGLPRPVTGAFASVYKVSTGPKTYAVRCFHNEIPDLNKRYSEILKEMNSHNACWQIKTEFIAEGIRTHGRWYPVVKMDWAEGLPLDRYLAKHGNDQTKVNNLVKQLRSILEDLRIRGIAHGDLQHGNILVVDDEVKLLDYDGFFVPALDGLKSAELGHANYQHPYRSREHFGSYIDNFPAWLITISLLSIAADPDLLKYSIDRECLLFVHADLISPYESEVFTRLREHPLEEIQCAARTLIRLLNCPVELVPFLDATEDELLELPEMDPSEQLRLMEEISETDQLRFLDRPQSLAALEKLSTTKRGAKDKFGFLLKQASSQGVAMLSSMMKQKLSMHENASRADSAFAAGSYQDAIEFYMRAWEQAKAEIETLDRKPQSRASGSSFNIRQFEDHLNLRLGVCHLINNSSGQAVFHFKNIVQKLKSQKKDAATLEAIAGLMMAYCQHGREQDAMTLMKEVCGCSTGSSAVMQPNELAAVILAYGNGLLAEVPGLKKALKVVAKYYETEEQYEHAASLYTAARATRDAGSQSDLELALSIGHCHLLQRRPDLAIGFFNGIKGCGTASELLLDRAAVAQAVAFKMMNARQDVAQCMRSRLPENLYNCFKSEANGLLGNLEEFAEVIAAFGAELGEANLMGGVRMATRLAADNFKRLDDKRSVEQLTALLESNNFAEADRLVTDELLQQKELKRKFFNGAQVFARNLATAGSYKYAFEVLRKYDCPTDLVVDAIENDICNSLRKLTREIRWNKEQFDATIALSQAYFEELRPGPNFARNLCEVICASADRTDEFLTDVRRLADLLAGRLPDGGSNQFVLRMRAFVLDAESPQEVQKLQEKPKLGNSDSALGSQFVKATRAAAVSTTESARTRQMEGDVLQTLRICSQNNWEPQSFEKVPEQFHDMRHQRCLTNAFCDKVASILLDHFASSSGLTRWNKQASAFTDEQGRRIKATLSAIMEIFAAVPNIDPGTLRKLRRSMERFDTRS